MFQSPTPIPEQKLILLRKQNVFLTTYLGTAHFDAQCDSLKDKAEHISDTFTQKKNQH